MIPYKPIFESTIVRENDLLKDKITSTQKELHDTYLELSEIAADVQDVEPEAQFLEELLYLYRSSVDNIKKTLEKIKGKIN